MASITSLPFGKTANGDAVTKYVLSEGGCTLSVLDYGGTVQALHVPDRDGKPVDIALGFSRIEDYEQHDKFLGALIGRCANRIAGGRFSLEGREYTLAQNEGDNHLHGGRGFDRRIWRAAEEEGGLALYLTSPDGDEGYPGRLEIRVHYTLQDHALLLDYQAKTDRTTLCNLTNHTYFNLSGHDRGTVIGQYIRVLAGFYTPANAEGIPTGVLAPVQGVMDLRTLQPMDPAGNDPALGTFGGYDHNWVIDGAAGAFRPAAEGYAPRTGIYLQMETTLPGVQFYMGGSLDGCPDGKGDTPYGKYSGFCLESQFYPDAIHHPAFPQPVLQAGERYHAQTVYRFSTR